MPNASKKNNVPTMPQGVEIASFGTYLDAQAAVDHLSDKAFPVQFVTIVGTNLKMVERVTGRLTYGRVTLAGLAAGAWFGLFVGLLLLMFGGSDAGLSVLAAIALGAGFGALFSLISYAFTGGKRDFTSSSQIVAASYTVLCSTEHAGPGRELLHHAGMGGQGQSAATPYTNSGQQPAARVAPGNDATTQDASAQQPPARESKPDAMYVTPDGRPRYGALRDDASVTPAADRQGTEAVDGPTQSGQTPEQQRES